VTWIVQAEFDSLDEFEKGIGLFDRHEALKVIFYPAVGPDCDRIEN